MSRLLLCSLLLTGCAAGEEVPATVPAETTEPTVSAPVVEIAATEATQPQEDDRIWHGLYWMEGEDKPHLRCMITNETDCVMRVESISAVYYQNGDIVREDTSATLANMEKMDQSLSYLDSVCLWVTNDLSLEEYDQALCTVMLHGDSGEETTQEFWFTTDETKVTHADPFAGKGFSYATLDNNNWGFWYFPENNTGEELSLEGWYWKNYMDGEPVVSGTYTMQNLPATASKLKILFADETTVHNNGISAQWCNYNQREDIFVWRNEQGEPYVQSFRFVLNEAKAGRVLDVVFPEEGDSGHEYKVSQEDPDSYASVIDFYDVLKALGKPQYTVAQIQEMIESELPLDEITEKIYTYADLFQYLYMKGYKVSQESDVHFVVGGIDWSVTHTAELVFESNTGNCGDGSNLVNYILKDDYDEQGYIHETYNDSGHIYNYFKEDGVYYFIDLIDLVTVVNSYDNADFRMGTGTDPKQISEYLVGEENQIGLMKDGSQIWMQCLFPCQGSHLAVDWNNLYFGGEGPELPYVYPESVADSMKILYKKDLFDDPRFELDPPKNRWPEGIK